MDATFAPAAASAAAAPAVVFRASQLTKVYRMGDVEVHALAGVDLELFAGEFLVLLGPSGSGKSTLLNILGGLDVPTSGTVAYRDSSLTSADERTLTDYRRYHVGFVFQFYNLIPSLTARENVELVTHIARTPMPPKRPSTWSAWPTGSIISRRSSRAASSSASPLPAPLPSVPMCCSATSRPARSTSPPASSCSKRSSA